MPRLLVVLAILGMAVRLAPSAHAGDDEVICNANGTRAALPLVMASEQLANMGNAAQIGQQPPMLPPFIGTQGIQLNGQRLDYGQQMGLFGSYQTYFGQQTGRASNLGFLGGTMVGQAGNRHDFVRDLCLEALLPAQQLFRLWCRTNPIEITRQLDCPR